MFAEESKQPSVTAEEARSIARDAYVFGLPLVYIGLQSDQQTSVAKPEGVRAPYNQFVHYREFPDAKHNAIVGMNVDTLYSLANLDLSAEPIVLSIPEMGDRFWLMQFLDAWNDVPGAVGARTFGGKGGNFVITGPTWKGTLPAGLTEIHSDTSLTMIGGRTYTSGKDDYAAVHQLQDQYTLTPLSKWGSAYTPPSDVPVKAGVDAKTPVTKQVFAMGAEAFFGRLNSLLPNNPPRPADEALVARMAKIGVATGARFTMDGFTPDVCAAIESGIKDGQKAIVDGHSKMGEIVNGWQLARDLGKYGVKYAYRATWTYFGVGGNLVEDAFYPTTQVDSDGNKLTGEHRYELRFRKDEIPPVDAFWSLTMYNADSYLVDNPLNRYSLSGRDPMQYGPDGSLTIYIQNKSPGPDKESNWLPAPKDAITLALRLYRPRQSVIDGTWSPPAVTKVD